MTSDGSDAHAAIARAVESARYNEAVVVTVHDGDDGAASPLPSREIVLVACLDPTNGGVVWKDAASAGGSGSTGVRAYDGDAASDDANGTSLREDPGIVRHLRTKRWALPMLNDRRRNRLYDAAVREACRRMVGRRDNNSNGNISNGSNNEGKSEKCKEDNEADKTIRILDIGSGTGLLAMMGARHALDAAAREKELTNNLNERVDVRVTSVEMASAMARLARTTVDENGLSDNVRVVEGHSTDADFVVDDARFDKNGICSNGDGICEGKAKADICTSELLESGLLGEGVLPSMRDAWSRHLRPDAIVVPRCARVLAVLVEGVPIIADDDAKVGDSSASEGSKLNAATSFLGPEPRAFREASAGVRMSTTAPPPDGPLDGGSVLLGSRCCGDEGGGCARGGVTVPLHADAMLDKHCHRGISAANLANERQQRGFRDFKRGIRPLSDPVAVLDFDFASGSDALSRPYGRTVSTRVLPTAGGICHGVLFWWELDLWDDGIDCHDDDENDFTYSTEPIGFVKRPKKDDVEDDDGTNDERESLWQDHWQQCLFLFGDGHCSKRHNVVESGSLRELTKGTLVEIIASHDDSSISFSLETNTLSSTGASIYGNGDRSEEDNGTRPHQRRKLNESLEERVQPQSSVMNRHITAARALQLNDLSRIRTLRAAIQHCIKVKGRDAPLLDLSDMGLCAMIASVSEGATKVTSLESCSGNLPTLAATIAQIGNGLPRAGAEFQIIQALAEHIRAEHVAGGAAEIVVAEPYYHMLQGWHLQEALNYFYLVRSLKSRGVISPFALSVPAHANVMACVVEFDEFATAYGPVGDNPSNEGGVGSVRGFRHAAVNRYGDRYHKYDVPLPLWQYRCRRLSEAFHVARISYEGAVPIIEAEDGGSVELASAGVAHCVAFWVEYACRTSDVVTGGEKLDVISTALSSHRQLVRKLRKPIAVTEADVKSGSTFSCKASFGDNSDGTEDHSFTIEFCRQEGGTR